MKIVSLEFADMERLVQEKKELFVFSQHLWQGREREEGGTCPKSSSL